MQASQRIGGLKAALVVCSLGLVALAAMAPAFACTPVATAQTKPARGEAGTVTELTGTLFKADAGSLVIKWGGSGGVLLTTTTVNADGTFGPTPVTIPANAEPGRVGTLALYQPADPGLRVVNVLFEVDGDPSVVTSPPQGVPEPAPAAQPSGALSTSPGAASTQPAAAQSTQPAVAPAPVPRVRPAPAVAAAPVPSAPVAQPAPAENSAPAPAPAPPVAEVPAPALEAPAPADVGPAKAPATATIDEGRSLWVLVPLIAVGLTLFAASSAVVLHEVRRRRQAVKA